MDMPFVEGDLTLLSFFFFFFNDTATTEIYTLSLHDALPIWKTRRAGTWCATERARALTNGCRRSEEHTSELQSLRHLVCRLLLEKKKMRRTKSLKSPMSDLRIHAQSYSSPGQKSRPRNRKLG